MALGTQFQDLGPNVEAKGRLSRHSPPARGCGGRHRPRSEKKKIKTKTSPRKISFLLSLFRSAQMWVDVWIQLDTEQVAQQYQHAMADVPSASMRSTAQQQRQNQQQADHSEGAENNEK